MVPHSYTHSISKKYVFPHDSACIQNIAIFRSLQLGDMLCAIPAIRSIRFAFPKAQITLLGLPWAKEFAQRFPQYINSFIEFPGFPGLPEKEYDKGSYKKFISHVQTSNFDVIFQMHGNGTITNKIIDYFDILYKVGYTTKRGYTPYSSYFYDYPEGEKEVNIWLRLINLVGLETVSDRLEFPIYQIDKKRAEYLQKKYSLERKKYICVHPGARDEKRRWDVQGFAKVADEFYKKGFKIVITGTEKEKDIVYKLQSRMKYDAASLVGETDLGSLAAVIKDAFVFISNDTGVSHLASAVQAKSVIVCVSKESLRWVPTDSKKNRVLFTSGNRDSYVVVREAFLCR